MSPERLGNFGTEDTDAGGEIRRHGISASPGIAIGRAFVVDADRLVVPRTRVDDVESEVSRFEGALETTRGEILEICADMTERMGEDHARIFDSHLMMLSDDTVVGATIERIRAQHLNAAAAFEETVDAIVRSFDAMKDEYLKDRAADIVDVKRRVLRHLVGGSTTRRALDEPSIVIAQDLSPSVTAQFDRAKVLAYATDRGGRTSHTAILARSQAVPAVVGLESLSARVSDGDTVIVDGNTGTVVVNPAPETLEEYEQERRRFQELEEQLLTLTGYPGITLDGREFGLLANIDMPSEVAFAVEHGAQGVGLFRTEYFFISRDELPGEDQQYAMYRDVVERLGGRPVTIRTIDIGGDKVARYLPGAAEHNPFMGWRGIRFFLTRRDVFRTQLRAIYRASAHGTVRIMFPMISSVDEVVEARAICRSVCDELRAEGVPFDENTPLGIMIETPAAVAVAEALGREADFFSIGTNDLIQYTLAVDRGNARIAHLYRNVHPAILRFLRQTVLAARKREIPVSVCGEVCADPRAVVLLIGMRIDAFSASPAVVPEIKRIIRSVTFDACRALLRRVMRLRTTAEVEAEVDRFLAEHLNGGGGNTT